MLKLAVRSWKLSWQMHQRFIKDSLEILRRPVKEILRVLKILWECWNVLEGPSKTLQRLVKDSLKWFINDSSTIHQRFFRGSSKILWDSLKVVEDFLEVGRRFFKILPRFIKDSSKILQRLNKDSLKSFQDALKLLLDSSKIHQRFFGDPWSNFCKILQDSSSFFQDPSELWSKKSFEIVSDSLRFSEMVRGIWEHNLKDCQDPSQGSIPRIPSKDCSNSLRILVGFTILPTTVFRILCRILYRILCKDVVETDRTNKHEEEGQEGGARGRPIKYERWNI